MRALTSTILEVPQSEEKSVQLVRGSSFRSDFLQNPYGKLQTAKYIHMQLRIKIHLDTLLQCLSRDKS